MAATIQIHEMTGASTGTDKTSGTIRFKAADNTTVDTNNRLQIPAAGDDYSYTKNIRAYMEAPPDTDIQNLEWYTDGVGFGTGRAVNVKTVATFTANVDTQMTGGNSLFGYTSGSPLDGDALDTGPFLPADDNSHIGDFLLMQMVVSSTSAPGTLSAETLTLSWTET